LTWCYNNTKYAHEWQIQITEHGNMCIIRNRRRVAFFKVRDNHCVFLCSMKCLRGKSEIKNELQYRGKIWEQPFTTKRRISSTVTDFVGCRRLADLWASLAKAESNYCGKGVPHDPRRRVAVNGLEISWKHH
jgi:hypothetical protein